MKKISFQTVLTSILIQLPVGILTGKVLLIEFSRFGLKTFLHRAMRKEHQNHHYNCDFFPHKMNLWVIKSSVKKALIVRQLIATTKHRKQRCYTQ